MHYLPPQVETAALEGAEHFQGKHGDPQFIKGVKWLWDYLCSQPTFDPIRANQEFDDIISAQGPDSQKMSIYSAAVELAQNQFARDQIPFITLNKELEFDADRNMKLSFAHIQKTKEQLEKALPEYRPTWEAGRACGFHAGLAAESGRIKTLLGSKSK